MVWTIREDINRLENTLRKLEKNPDSEKAQRGFWASTRVVCHTALTAAKCYPGVFDKEKALTLEALFEAGLIILDEAEVRQEIIKGVQQRYNKLKPYIEKEKQSTGSLASEWPVLDPGKPYGGQVNALRATSLG